MTVTPTEIQQSSFRIGMIENLHLPYDLLFLAEGTVWRLNRGEDKAFPILAIGANDLPASKTLPTTARSPGVVTDYRLDQRARSLFMLSSKGIAANGVEMFELLHYELETGILKTLIPDTSRLSHFSVSPDGNWLIYTLENQPVPIYILNADGSRPAAIIGRCHFDLNQGCDHFAWAEDSRFVIWSDHQGVWIADPATITSWKVIGDRLDVTDLLSGKATILASYSNLEWSPKGRFLLATVNPEDSIVHWRALIDTRRGHVAEVPGTYEYLETTARVIWTDNGDLFIVRSLQDDQVGSIELETWKIVPTREDMLLIDRSHQFSNVEMNDQAALDKRITSYFPDLPSQIDRDRYSLYFQSQDSEINSFLSIYETKLNHLIGISELPNDIVQIQWSSDGSGALLIGDHGSALYLSLQEGLIYDLRQLLGESAASVRWFPVESRSIQSTLEPH